MTCPDAVGPPSGTARDRVTSPTVRPPPSIEGGTGTRVGLEETWAELERLGRNTGHVLVRCPSCAGRAMVSIVNSSGTSRWVKSGGGWPKCKQCRDAPRVEPVGDVALVARVRPGYGITERELKRILKVREAKGGAPADEELKRILRVRAKATAGS